MRFKFERWHATFSLGLTASKAYVRFHLGFWDFEMRWRASLVTEFLTKQQAEKPLGYLPIEFGPERYPSSGLPVPRKKRQ